ncbi:hypothetical protein BJX70DRAFT_400953 [Aspergillus crustosus]
MPFTTGDGSLLHLNDEVFDFNLQFEHLFFSITPAALFIPTVSWHTLSQARKPVVVKAPAFLFIKLGALTIYAGLELTLLVLVVIGSFNVTCIFIASSVLQFVAALFMLTLSVIDHSRSPRPSVLLNSYLFVTLRLNAALTFAAATRARLEAGDDGAALTLMSTDIERIRQGLRAVHETWASMIQAALAAWMLYRQLHIVFIAPLGVVAVCFAGLRILVRFTGDSQRAWMSGVQKRVGLTATVMSSTKPLKISGLSAVVAKYVQQLRVNELAAGARFRKIVIIAVVFAWLPQILSPPLTFAFAQTPLDTSTTFTSLSFLALMTSPLSQLFQQIPDMISALACLSRIQAFLEVEPRYDFRQIHGCLYNTEKKASEPLPLTELIVIKDASFGWKKDKPALQNINTRIPASSLTMVVGPQSAFLWNGTVRDNIVGFSPFDAERYHQVIEAAALRFDLETLPQSDATNIGSDGVALSGGQKQRVSLARALYLHSDLLLLDDVFSGLDADTEDQVFRPVFGAGGLLRHRGSTVILCTHSVKHLPAADHIIALEDGEVVEQGTFESPLARPGYVQRLGVKGEEAPEKAISAAVPKAAVSGSKSEVPQSTAVESSTSPTQPNSATAAARQVGDTTVYKHYIKSMGYPVAVLSVFSAALWGFFTNYPTICVVDVCLWTNKCELINKLGLTYWSDATHGHAYYAGIYALFQVCAILSLLVFGIAMFVVSVRKAGASLHQQALATLMRAPLSFFTKTDTGVVTNLFSQDLNLIDTELPKATVNTLFYIFMALGQAAVMLTSSAYLAISYPSS